MYVGNGEINDGRTEYSPADLHQRTSRYVPGLFNDRFVVRAHERIRGVLGRGVHHLKRHLLIRWRGRDPAVVDGRQRTLPLLVRLVWLALQPCTGLRRQHIPQLCCNDDLLFGCFTGKRGRFLALEPVRSFGRGAGVSTEGTAEAGDVRALEYRAFHAGRGYNLWQAQREQ